MNKLIQPKFLPTTKEEMLDLGWDELDILLVNGDAYVDHPSFGAALLGRYLVAHGYRVGIIAQPKFDDTTDIMAMGRPRLFAGVSAGAIDSMLAHYTAFRKKRHNDEYTAGGSHGARPNRAVIIYSNLLRRAFPKLPVVAGGIEASLRRFTHYDFWTDSLRKSLLFDAKLDLVIYGMGEKAIVNVANNLDKAVKSGDSFELSEVLAGIKGTARILNKKALENLNSEYIELPSFEEQIEDRAKVLEAALLHEKHMHIGKMPILERMGDRAIWLEPAQNIDSKDLDFIYTLPFSRIAHPKYKQEIPAASMIKNSITGHRGCGGGCSFCSLTLHQGRKITSRSAKSILDEVATIAKSSKKPVSITDIGGPSANMWQAVCAVNKASCERRSCLFPEICKHFIVDQNETIDLLRATERVENIRNVRVASGIRFDLAIQDKEALAAYVKEFTGGQLKLAPEHSSNTVLKNMRKPSLEVFEKCLSLFKKYSRQKQKEQYIVPYLMSAMPGCTDKDMKDLALWLENRNWQPQQVQCFIPTPGTVATAMYYSGLDESGRDIFVAYTDAQRLRQHGFLIKTERVKPPQKIHTSRR